MQKEEKKLRSTFSEDEITQLIVFHVGDEEFGIPIVAVREIIKMTSITGIPNSPAYIKGIVSVRGEIVTAIDIKLRFSLSIDKENESDEKHMIVVKNDNGLFGLVVDEVIEVLRVQKKEIKPSPHLFIKINQEYIRGIINHEERLIILLDLDKVLSYQAIMKSYTSDKKYTKKKSSREEIHDKNTHY